MKKSCYLAKNNKKMNILFLCKKSPRRAILCLIVKSYKRLS